MDCLRNYCIVFRVSSRVKNGETVVTSCSYRKKSPIFIDLIYFQEYQLIRSSLLMDSDAISIVLK
jgi:hypothetical protein